jgi:hypothetical protein
MRSTYNLNHDSIGMVRSITERGVLVSLFAMRGELIGEIIGKRLSKRLKLRATFRYDLSEKMEIKIPDVSSRAYLFSPMGYRDRGY